MHLSLLNLGGYLVVAHFGKSDGDLVLPYVSISSSIAIPISLELSVSLPHLYPLQSPIHLHLHRHVLSISDPA